MAPSKLLTAVLAGAVLAVLALAPGSTYDTYAGTGEPPPNDDRADATDLGSLPFVDGPIDISGATLEPGEPHSACGFPAFGSVWYRITPDADHVLVASAPSDEYRLTLAVWTEQRSELAQVACSEGRFGRTVAKVDAGRTYFIQAGHTYGDTTAPVTFEFVEREALANDDFEDATAVGALPFTDSVNTEAATRESAEPRNCIGGKYAIAPDSTLWYAYEPDEDVTVIADTNGSDFDTVIAVWTAGTFGLETVACTAVFNNEENQGARVAFRAEAGQVYHIQVGGLPYSTAFGNLELSLTAGVGPANDDFANALDITSLPFEHTVDTLAATTEPGEPTPTCTNLAIDTTAWYRFKMDVDTLITMELEENVTPSLVGVYQGNSVADLEQVLCGQAWYSSKFAFEARAGETYYLQIGTPLRRGPPLFDPDAAGLGEGYVVRFSGRPLPACPAPAVLLADNPGDVAIWFEPRDPDRRHDILSVGTSVVDGELCVRLEFARPVAPPDAATVDAIRGNLWLDTNAVREGYSIYTCGSERLLGVDAEISLYGGAGLLAPIYAYWQGEDFADDDVFAVTLFDDRTMTILVPAEVVGAGADPLRLVVRINDPASTGEDCAPDRGFLQMPPPAFGDANCDGAVDSRDAVMILQFFARLAQALPCEYVADANGNGTIGSIDAALILQFGARLLDVLPGAP